MRYLSCDFKTEMAKLTKTFSKVRNSILCQVQWQYGQEIRVKIEKKTK